jgi:hypothetical protein
LWNLIFLEVPDDEAFTESVTVVAVLESTVDPVAIPVPVTASPTETPNKLPAVIVIVGLPLVVLAVINCLAYKSPEIAEIILGVVPVEIGAEVEVSVVDPIEIQPLTFKPKVVYVTPLKTKLNPMELAE